MYKLQKDSVYLSKIINYMYSTDVRQIHKLGKYYYKFMHGGHIDKRDCTNISTIKVKWNNLRDISALDPSTQIVMIDENNNLVDIKEPMTFGQNIGIMAQTVIPVKILDPITKKITDACKYKYGRNINCMAYTEKEKYIEDNKKYIEDFVSTYKIKTERFDIEPRQCETLNKYFIRKYKKDFYECLSINDDEKYTVFRSPATSYTLLFTDENQSKEYWIKDKKYTIKELVNGESVDGESVDGESVNGESVLAEKQLITIINRLAPGHYHRFHVPINCEIIGWKYIPGILLSVSAKVVRSSKSVYIGNKRIVLKMQNKNIGIFYMVIIGAVCVGSIQFEDKYKDYIKITDPNIEQHNDVKFVDNNQGDDLGYFQFGGSTIITIIPNNKNIVVNPLIQKLSTREYKNQKSPIEMEVEVFDPLCYYGEK